MISKGSELPAIPSLGSKIMDGAIWNTFQLLVARGTALLVQLVLARLLLPEHFGIVGMAAVFIGAMGAVGDLGLASALIQFKREKLSDEHLTTVFWSSLAFSGLILLLLVVAFGPFAAWFYDTPVLRLVIPILGVGNVLKSLGLIHRVILTRELRFKPIGLVEAAASVLSGIVAIGAALAGAGVWSLIIKDISFIGISIPLLWSSTNWRPAFRFSRKAFLDTFRAGSYDALNRLFLFLTKNIDYLLVGRFLGAELLGIYTLAFLLTDTVRGQIWAILNKVMFPVYSQIQDDLTQVKDYYLRIVKYNLIAVTPFMLILIFLAQPLLRILFGERWLPAVFPMQVMALAAIVSTIGGTSGAVMRGLGKFDLNLRLTALNVLFVTIPAFWIGVYYFGINGAAVAALIHQVTLRTAHQWQMRKLVGARERDILNTLRLSLYGTLATLPLFAWAMFFLEEVNFLSLLGVSGLIGLVYGLTVFSINRVEFIRLYRMLVRRRAAQQ